MTIIEQLVEDYKKQNPDATPQQIKEYIQTLEPYTKVIKEDEWAFNADQDDTASEDSEGKPVNTGSTASDTLST